MDKNNLIKTLAFFDIFDQPLTKDEIFKYLWQEKQINLNDVQNINDFYFLSNHQEIVKKRQNRQSDLEKKLKIAKRAVKKMRWVPFLEAVFLCNNLAFGVSNDDSDIDVLVVVRDGRIWTARFFTTLFLQVFGLRRHGKKIKNRICLSFYLSDKYLNLRNLRIESPDVYLIYWLASLKPIYDIVGITEKIQRANKWILEYLPNAFNGPDDSSEKDKNGGLAIFFKNVLERMWGGRYGDLIETQMREMQKTKMKMNLYSKQNKNNSEVVINDRMLKFHENDRRHFYQEKWIEKIKNLTV